MNMLGTIIRDNRKSKGLLLRHLASELDIDVAVLSKIERGERIPSKIQIKNIAEALKMDENYLNERLVIDKILIDLSEFENQLEIINKVKIELNKKSKR